MKDQLEDAGASPTNRGAQSPDVLSTVFEFAEEDPLSGDCAMLGNVPVATPAGDVTCAEARVASLRHHAA